MSLYGPSKEAKAAHKAIGTRWKRAQETLGRCSSQPPYGEGTRSYKALKLVPVAEKAYAPYRDSDPDDFDDLALNAWQADVYRIEQELLDLGCTKEGGARAEPFPVYDDQKDGSEAWKAANKIDQAAPRPEDAKDWWEKVPLAAKIAGGALVATALLGNLARIMRR